MTMAKLAPPKKASKPTAPKKPSTRSKTGNAACSEAASNWQLSLRGKASLDPETYRTLAKCRAMNRTAKMAEAQGRTGKLSAMGESAVKARLQVRFDSGLITQKARTERLDMLLKQRSQRGNSATGPKTAFSYGVAKSEKIPAVPAEYQAYRSSEYVGMPKQKPKTSTTNPAFDPKAPYDPTKAIEKDKGGRYWALDSSGNRFPTPFKTKHAALERTTAHQALKQSQIQGPTPTPPAAPKLAPGRGTDERKATAEFLLKQRSERGKVEAAVVAKPAMTAENKGTYGDYYFTPEGKYVSMSGSGGMGSNRVGARDINGKMIGWYDRKELRFANEKQRPTKESESASERLSEISKEVSDLREKNARLLIGRDTTDKLRRELSQGNITKEKYDELVKKGYALSDKDYSLSGEVQKQIESVKSRLVQRGTEGSGGEAIPPKPAARYSLGGKLAPGRGKDAPEYRDRLGRVYQKTWDRAKKYEFGYIENPKQPLAAYKERGKELRLGTVSRLKTAYDAEASKYVDSLHAAQKTPAAAPPTANKASGDRWLKRQLKGIERDAKKKRETENAALKAGAVPLSMKPATIPSGFEASVVPGDKGSTIVVTKPVKGSEYAAIQLNENPKKGKYSLMDPKSGVKIGGGYGSAKEAEAVAKKIDRLAKRASRGLSGDLTLPQIVSAPGKEGYKRLIGKTVFGRRFQYLPR